MGTMVVNPTVVLIFSSESPSPTKNRNRDKWRRPGTASATVGRCHFSNPSRKYCRSRALFKGSESLWKTSVLLRTHFWMTIAKNAAKRLEMRPRNQKTFTRISDDDGLNAGKWSGGVEGMETCGAMEASCWEI